MYWIFWRYFLTGQLPRPLSTLEGEPPSRLSSQKPDTNTPSSQFLDAFEDQLLCLLDADYNCLQISDNWQTITGHTPEHCINQSLFKRLHPDHYPKLVERFSRVETKTGQGAAERQRCQMMHEDGEWYWYDMSIMPAEVLGYGDSAVFACVMRHISEQVQTQKTLQKARLEAELALKGRSEFLANMSHDLRTPLNAIIGFSQMMENQLFGKLNNKRYLEYLGNIQESGHDLLAKINDLLELSNLDTGRISLQEEQVDLARLFQAAIDTHAQYAFSNQIAIEKEFPCADIQVQADRLKLKRCISNVLSNALLFSAPESVVQVSCRLLPGNSLAIVVSDKGRGIPKDHLRNIHTALNQENSLFAREYNGIGLGLALVKEFIGLHQGDLTIDSQPGVGSTVTLTLPRERVLSINGKMTTKKKRRLSA